MANKPIILEFDSSSAEELLKFYELQIGAANIEVNELYKKLEIAKEKVQSLVHRYNSINRQLRGAVNDTENNSVEFNPDWSVSSKTEFVLRKKNKLLTTRQIIEAIQECEPNILKKYDSDFDRFQKNLASTLVQKVQNGKTFDRYKGIGEFRYGLKEWFDKAGMPKKEFLKDIALSSSFFDGINAEQVVLNGQQAKAG